MTVTAPPSSSQLAIEPHQLPGHPTRGASAEVGSDNRFRPDGVAPGRLHREADASLRRLNECYGSLQAALARAYSLATTEDQQRRWRMQSQQVRRLRLAVEEYNPTVMTALSAALAAELHRVSAAIDVLIAAKI